MAGRAREGHTWVLSGAGVRPAELLALADWRGNGTIPSSARRSLRRRRRHDPPAFATPLTTARWSSRIIRSRRCAWAVWQSLERRPARSGREIPGSGRRAHPEAPGTKLVPTAPSAASSAVNASVSSTGTPPIRSTGRLSMRVHDGVDDARTAGMASTGFARHAKRRRGNARDNFQIVRCVRIVQSRGRYGRSSATWTHLTSELPG
jgi:hypothetical protein